MVHIVNVSFVQITKTYIILNLIMVIFKVNKIPSLISSEFKFHYVVSSGSSKAYLW